MTEAETLEDFYQRKYPWMPETLQNDIGHFNVFLLEPYVGEKARPVPYKKRDYFKIMLVLGKGQINFADQVVEVKKQALSFSNPNIPYKWGHTLDVESGVFCVFDNSFFEQYGGLGQYPVFQPEGTHVFELEDTQVPEVKALFERMMAEIASDYIYKYDVLRTLVLELVHFALKMQPQVPAGKPQINASQRISTLFLDLLERQFPIDEAHQVLTHRTPSDYARQLNIHVNHLNRAIRESTDKTTSQLIADRIAKEARILLKHSTFSVSEIAYALGFTEVTHFNNFFKKHVKMSPLQYRKV